MSFEPAMSLTEQIAEHIGTDIIHGRLKPLSRIQELKVAGELGVSRGSVREALLILERRHLIEIVPRRGAVVSAMEGREIANFCELYAELQTLFFCKLAVAPERRLDVFEAPIADLAAAVSRSDNLFLLTARRRFLEAGLPLVDNFYLSSVLRGLIPAGLRVAHVVAAHPSYDPRDTLRYHQALYGALQERQTERVRELVQAYSSREKRLALGCVDGDGAALERSARRNV